MGLIFILVPAISYSIFLFDVPSIFIDISSFCVKITPYIVLLVDVFGNIFLFIAYNFILVNSFGLIPVSFILVYK